MKRTLLNNRITYTLGDTIGSGRFGKVYAATNRQKQQFAIKIVERRKFPKEFLKFEEEAHTLAKLKHPNIIEMVQFICDHNQIWIVMPRAQFDLSRLLTIKRAFSEDQIRQIGQQIVQAMTYLFQMKIIHRDLKPHNILIDKKVIKLCDFGQALQINSTNNYLQIAGTPLYMAPQAVADSQYGHKADVWSLGIVLYELATGKTPYYSCQITKLRQFIKNEPIIFPPNLSPYFKQLLEGMLVKDPSSRFDWTQVKNHPFFYKQKQFSLQKILQQAILKEKENQGNQLNLSKVCKDIIKFIEDYNDHKTRRHDKHIDEIFKKISQFLQEYSNYKNSKRQYGIPIQHFLIIIHFIKQLVRDKQVFLTNLTIAKQLMNLLFVCCQGQSNEGLLYAQYQVIRSLFSNISNVEIVQPQQIQVMLHLIEMEINRQCSDPVWEVMRELSLDISNHVYGNLYHLEEVFIHLHHSKFFINLANQFELGISKKGKMVIDCIIAFIRPELNYPISLSQSQSRMVAITKQNIVRILLERDFLKSGWMARSSFLKMMLQCLLQSQYARKLFAETHCIQKIAKISSSTNYLMIFTFILEQTYKQGKINHKIEDLNKMMVSAYRNERSQEVLNLYIIHCLVNKIGNKKIGSSQNEINARISIVQTLQRILFFSDELKNKFCITTFGSLQEVWIKPNEILISNALLLSRHHDDLTPKERTILGNLISNLIQCDANYTNFSLICSQLVRYQRHQYFCSMPKFRMLIKLVKKLKIQMVELNKNILVWKHLFIYVMKTYTYKQKERQFIIKVIRQTNFWNQIFQQQNQTDVNAALIFITSYRGPSINLNLFHCDQNIFMKCFQLCKHSQIRLIRLHIVEFLLKYLIQVDERGYRSETKGMIQFCNELLDFKDSQDYKFAQILIDRTLILIAEIIKHRKGVLTAIEYRLLIPKIVDKLSQVSGKTVFWVKNSIIQIINNLCSYGELTGKQIDSFITNFIPHIFTNEISELYPNILQLIGNLVEFSDAHIDQLYKLGIIGEIEDRLQREDRPIVKQLLSIIKMNVQKLNNIPNDKISKMWTVNKDQTKKLSCLVQS